MNSRWRRLRLFRQLSSCCARIRYLQPRTLVTGAVLSVISVIILCSVILREDRSSAVGALPEHLPFDKRMQVHKGMGKFRLSEGEEADVYFRRPNWRQRASGGASGDNDIRVMLIIMTNRMDDISCAAVASAYLAGLPIVIAGYPEPFQVVAEKYRFAAAALRRAGMRPQDVVLTLDNDVLINDGTDLVAVIDRFITLSPESPESLDARAIRQADGSMLAPLIISAETNCFAGQLPKGNANATCREHYRMHGENTFQAYHSKVFPRSQGAEGPQQHPDGTPGAGDIFTPNVNSGVILARVWAFDEVYAAFTQYMKNIISGQWWCDQTVFTILYLDLIKFEAEADMLTRQPAALEFGGGKVERRSPNGLRAGLMSVDYNNDISGNVFPGALAGVHVDDRFWRPENQARVREHVAQAQRHFSDPCGEGDGGGIDGKSRHLCRDSAASPKAVGEQLRRLTWRWLGSQVDLSGAATVSVVPKAACAAHMVEKLVARNSGNASGQVPIAPETAERLRQEESFVADCEGLPSPSGGVGGDHARPGGAPLPFAFNVSLAEAIASPIAAGTATVQSVPPVVWLQNRFGTDARRWHAAFPPIIHFSGGTAETGKGESAKVWTALAPWHVPTDAPARAGGGRSRRSIHYFLAGKPIELWSSTTRKRTDFREMCLPQPPWL